MARILIAPDSFKGSATSAQVAHALAAGWISQRPDDQIVIAPFADGGEGTLTVIESVNPDVRVMPIRVQGATGIEHDSYWLMVNGDIAFIEMAALCGITTVEKLDPLGAHSFGLGQAIKAALENENVNEILIAIGGSASTDGGLGALDALGYRAVDLDGQEVKKGGGELHNISAIDRAAEIRHVARGIKILIDVHSPLTGEDGAAFIFAPQKGADADQVLQLDRGLTHLLDILQVEDRPGFGAAGGVACGLSVLLGATIVSGVETIAQTIGLEEKIAESDCVITGEGSFDHQSFAGKAVGYLLELAGKSNRPVMIACGVNKNESAPTIVSLVELAPTVESAIAESQRWLHECGKILATRLNH